MRTVKTFWNVAEAGFAHSLLEAAGLHPFLANEYANALGGGPSYTNADLHLQVHEAEYEQAMRVLTHGPDGEPLADSNAANV
jgi:hypothetical protein